MAIGFNSIRASDSWCRCRKRNYAMSIQRLFDAVERRGDIGLLPLFSQYRTDRGWHPAARARSACVSPARIRAARIWRPETMLLITRLYIRFWKHHHRSSRFVEGRHGHTLSCLVSWVMMSGVALGLSCVTYCHIRIKLAATSTTDEPAFLATLIELSVCSRQFRVSNEPKMVSGTKRSPARTIRLIGYKPPAPEVFVPAFAAWPAALRRPAPPTLAQRPTLNLTFHLDHSAGADHPGLAGRNRVGGTVGASATHWRAAHVNWFTRRGWRKRYRHRHEKSCAPILSVGSGAHSRDHAVDRTGGSDLGAVPHR